MVDMTVMGISLDMDTRAPLLILREGETSRIMPIWIGPMEALFISLALGGVGMPRPIAHDLMLKLLRGLDGTLTAARITKIHEGTFYAEMEIQAGEKRLTLDCRPSDAIALALRADAPIQVAEHVLQETGQIVRLEDLAKNLRTASTNLAMIFSATQSRELLQTPVFFRLTDDIIADAGLATSKKQKKQPAEPASPSDARIVQAASALDLGDQATLEELMRSLVPETKYKM